MSQEAEFLDEIQTKAFFKEFSSLLYTVTSTALPWDFYSRNLLQFLEFSYCTL